MDILSIEQVADDFHARYWKHSKTYEFLVDNGRPKNPMMRHYATHYPYQLDLAPMQEAIQDLVGTHDFTGFTASGTAVENKVRTITRATLEQDEKTGFLVFTFTGNGFLYKQVRIMVGTLLKIGNGRMPVSQIKTVLLLGKDGRIGRKDLKALVRHGRQAGHGYKTMKLVPAIGGQVCVEAAPAENVIARQG